MMCIFAEQVTPSDANMLNKCNQTDKRQHACHDEATSHRTETIGQPGVCNRGHVLSEESGSSHADAYCQFAGRSRIDALECQKWSRFGERPHTCAACGASFKTLDALRKHKYTHRNERPYTCSECMTSFKTRNALKGHMRVHSEDRPYACNVCMASFKTNSMLNRHRRVHTDERPYGCDQCGKSF